ncbi:MAG: OB-fold nucleic acid binding domain-containing protein [Desulfomonilaceae bacterium]
MKQVQSFVRECAEQTLREVMSMSVYCHAHPLTSLRRTLTKQQVVTSGDLRRMLSGAIVRVSGMVIIVHTPPTKSGKRVMFLTLEDETGLFDVVVFSIAQSRFAKLILTSEILTIEGRLQRKGPGGLSISVVMSRALTGLSGGLAKLLANEMKIRLLPRKKELKPPSKSSLKYEQTGSESSEQLGLVY